MGRRNKKREQRKSGTGSIWRGRAERRRREELKGRQVHKKHYRSPSREMQGWMGMVVVVREGVTSSGLESPPAFQLRTQRRAWERRRGSPRAGPNWSQGWERNCQLRS